MRTPWVTLGVMVGWIGCGRVPAPSSDAGSAMLELTPGNVDFGAVAYGKRSGPVTLTLTNIGHVASGPLSIAIAGTNATDFTQVTDCGGMLDAGASCTISVEATATALGSRTAILNASASVGSASAALEAVGDYAYNDLAAEASWLTADLTSINPAAAVYSGSTFDGRYIYFVPGITNNGLVIRCDSSVALSATSCSAFDLKSINSNAKGYIGASFDGRYVYFVPNTNLPGTDGDHGFAARYDTQAPFSQATSWSVFDLTNVNANAKGFIGAAFDGRYIYFAPYNRRIAVRFDTQAAFNQTSSWRTFDLTNVSASATGFRGTVFDGRHIYFIPSAGKLVARYDTQASFTQASAWETFDVTSVDANAFYFWGGAFDGRYVYFSPGFNSVAARYDTHGTFTQPDAWSVFDITAANPKGTGFWGAVFDGRRVYFAPYFNGDNTHGAKSLIVTYDTSSPFTQPTSWSTYDIASVNPDAIGFMGAAFDGTHVYFVPFYGTVVARFKAREPVGVLPQLCTNSTALHCFTGSFL